MGLNRVIRLVMGGYLCGSCGLILWFVRVHRVIVQGCLCDFREPFGCCVRVIYVLVGN